jgi:hypothetical protein
MLRNVFRLAKSFLLKKIEIIKKMQLLTNGFLMDMLFIQTIAKIKIKIVSLSYLLKENK